VCSKSNKSAGLVECGRVGRAVALKGECQVIWASGSCPVSKGEHLLLSRDGKSEFEKFAVVGLRTQGSFSIVRFDGISDRNSAKTLNGSLIFIEEERLPQLGKGEYYSYQILGMKVVTEEGIEVGEIVRIFTAGENDVYEILPDGAKRGSEIMVPAISEVIRNIDIAKKVMTIRPMEGMLDQG